MSRWFKITIVCILAAGTFILSSAIERRRAAEREYQRQSSLAAADADRIRAQQIIYAQYSVPAGHTLTDSLESAGVASSATSEIVLAAKPVYDLRRVRAGNELLIGRSVTGDLRGIRYQLDPVRMLDVKSVGGGFAASINEIPTHTEAAGIVGKVRDSLFNAVAEAGESPELAIRLAQIFGYDLDFYTDPRPGDSFRVLVEKIKYLDGKSEGYGRVLAAEYSNAGHAYQAVLFHDPAGNPAYYSPDGKSLQKAFLRSPLKFAAPITSRFSLSRYHPILKSYRPHLGIDYGAPTGTPVQTIGAGRVVFAGRKGGDGNMVHIAHSNGYETMYLHLSRILVREGARVTQGQIIGLVGMTGLATGPHLDFRILQRGEFRNFLALHLPPSDPVAPRDEPEFEAEREKWMPLLESIQEDVKRAALVQPMNSSPNALLAGGR